MKCRSTTGHSIRPKATARAPEAYPPPDRRITPLSKPEERFKWAAALCMDRLRLDRLGPARPPEVFLCSVPCPNGRNRGAPAGGNC